MRGLIKKYQLDKPFILLDIQKMTDNIRFMADKAKKHNLLFRPHFKTHKSEFIGNLFKDAGVEKITVSSVSMAEYFARAGWKDILIAFPVNLPEINKINSLAEKVNLSLLVDNQYTINELGSKLQHKVDLWLKINTGYNRAGIYIDDKSGIMESVKTILNTPLMDFRGLLTHNGLTYTCNGREAILASHNDSVSKMIRLKNELAGMFDFPVKVSIGDTPGCRFAEDFTGIDEIRPGNFVFYDWMQYRFGVCETNEIAVKLVAPVVSVLKSPSRIVLYAGAVHLSKDSVGFRGVQEYGAVEISGEIFPINRLSQEHGIVKVPDTFSQKIKPGDFVQIYPAHSCLTVDLYKWYYTNTGEKISSMEKFIDEQ